MLRLSKYRRLSRADRLLTLEAGVLLLVSALALKLMPFRWVARFSGARSAPAPGVKVITLPSRHPGLPGQVGCAVERAARHLPIRLLCLPQAIAAQWMLRLRGIASTLHFGMALSADAKKSMRAHAWLTVERQGIIGLRASQGFTEMTRFSHEVPGSLPDQ